MGFVKSMSRNLNIWGVLWTNQVQMGQNAVRRWQAGEGCRCHQVSS